MSYVSKAFRNAVDAASGYCHDCTQSAYSIILKLKELRDEPEIFQKVFQVAIATIQYINWQFDTNYLARFRLTMEAANMRDFYLLFKRPYSWLLPIQAQTLNAPHVLDKVVERLCSQFGQPDDTVIRRLVKSAMQKQLDSMAANQDGFRNIHDYLVDLQAKIRRENALLATADLTSLHIDKPLNSGSFLDFVIHQVWLFVDVGCVGLYLTDWNLIDTAKWANQIGQLKVSQYEPFAWIKNQSLDVWVRGAVSAAFLLQACESLRKLTREKLTAQGKRIARWEVITSVSEVILHGSGFLNRIGVLNVAPGFIYVSAIVAKSLGVLSIATRPKPKYFETAAAA